MPVAIEKLEMENLYMEWTLEDDQSLYEYMKVHQSSSQESLPRIASKLGRGLRGVQSRMAKLNDVDSFAYQRLFVKNSDHSGSWSHIESDDSSTDNNGIMKKLTPALEVMRRIKWDYSLDPLDFTVEYFDRVEETVMSSPFGAKNNSVKGKEEMFVFAIPEHRIMAMKYKDRIVWDKVCDKSVSRFVSHLRLNKMLAWMTFKQNTNFQTIKYCQI